MIKGIPNYFEDLISEASRTNTEILNEITTFLKTLDKSKLNLNYLSTLQQNIFTDALERLIMLNLNYTKELMQIGVELSKKLNTPVSDSGVNERSARPVRASSVSAFELKAQTEAGQVAEIAFLLNSDRDTPILCKVQNEPYHLASDEGVAEHFKTRYEPQLFELVKGISQRVDVQIEVPPDTMHGIYKSKITVAGFEHTYFDLVVEVIQAKDTPLRNTPDDVSSAPSKRRKTSAKNLQSKSSPKKNSGTSTQKKSVAKKNTHKRSEPKKR